MGAAPPPWNKPLQPGGGGTTPRTRHASDGTFAADDGAPTRAVGASGGVTETIADNRVGEGSSGRGAAGEPELPYPADCRRAAQAPANLPIRAERGRTPSGKTGHRTPKGPARNARISGSQIFTFLGAKTCANAYAKTCAKNARIFTGAEVPFFYDTSAPKTFRVFAPVFAQVFRADFRVAQALVEIPEIQKLAAPSACRLSAPLCESAVFLMRGASTERILLKCMR